MRFLPYIPYCRKIDVHLSNFIDIPGNKKNYEKSVLHFLYSILLLYLWLKDINQNKSITTTTIDHCQIGSALPYLCGCSIQGISFELDPT